MFNKVVLKNKNSNEMTPLSIGCVRLGNQDLDFENLNPALSIKREIRKRISPPEKSVLRVDFN